MINSVELFCGAGGLALGFHQAGFRPKALIEWDKDSCESIRSNIADGFCNTVDWNVMQTDVRLVNYSEFGLDVHFVTGGPPCQPFSLGGKHKAHSDVRDMFPEAVRAVRELRPQGFVFENVKGLLRNSFSSYFNYILLQLTHPEIIANSDMNWTDHLRLLEEYHSKGSRDGLEYNVAFRLLNAADYGVPQIRHRVIIVGFRNDLDINWSFPEQTHTKEALLYAKYGDGSYWEEHKIPKRLRSELSSADKRIDGQLMLPYANRIRWQTVRDAIKELPDPRSDLASTYSNHEYRGGARQYMGHSGSVQDEPSKAIKAGVHGVPGGENTMVLDSGELRYYTVRESARIQTFPDDYNFRGSWTESMRQIGNAVPVRLAYLIGDSIANHFERMNANNAQRHTAIRAI